jgi:hypothetical protein
MHSKVSTADILQRTQRDLVSSSYRSKPIERKINFVHDPSLLSVGSFSPQASTERIMPNDLNARHGTANNSIAKGNDGKRITNDVIGDEEVGEHVE